MAGDPITGYRTRNIGACQPSETGCTIGAGVRCGGLVAVSVRRVRSSFMLAVRALALASALMLVARAADAPREFRVYPSFEGEDAAAPLPPDWKVPGEFVLGRLMYPSRGFGFFGQDWTQGGTGWTDDYPRGDRTMIGMLRRLSRMSVRAVEQPVNLDDGDEEFFPFLLVGLAFSWELTDRQAAGVRGDLLHGGV